MFPFNVKNGRCPDGEMDRNKHHIRKKEREEREKKDKLIDRWIDR